ncbi:MAG: antibiotic biosynthesis monooxygenase [Pseudolabrys sp.]|nr:antibiotic biosynthesis monooxygenase [Pseudolabrys sp.]
MTYVVVARWRPKDGQEARIKSILQELTVAIRNEPGNLEFIAHQSVQDPNEILLYEQYVDEQAFLDHRATAHFKTLVLEQAVPLLARREIEMFSILT